MVQSDEDFGNLSADFQVYLIFRIDTSIYQRQVDQSGHHPIHAYEDVALLDDHAFRYLRSPDSHF